MCNDYAREIEAGRVIAAMEEMKNIPPFSYTGGRIPNDIAPAAHIKIRDRGFVMRCKEDRLGGEVLTWAWLQESGRCSTSSRKAETSPTRIVF